MTAARTPTERLDNGARKMEDHNVRLTKLETTYEEGIKPSLKRIETGMSSMNDTIDKGMLSIQKSVLELNKKMDAEITGVHEKVNDLEIEDAKIATGIKVGRWIVGTAIAALSAAVGLISLVIAG